MTLALAALATSALLAGCTSDDPYTGDPYVRTEKIQTRRLRPTKEELDRNPPPPYEQTLRAEAAERERLEVPKDVHESSKFIEQTDRSTRAAVGPGFGPAHDPWMSYEDDRRRVLVREWADTGKPEIPPPEPKKERVIEDDPYAPAPKVGKKDAGGDDAGGDKPAGDDKKADAGDKPAEGDKKGE